MPLIGLLSRILATSKNIIGVIAIRSIEGSLGRLMILLARCRRTFSSPVERQALTYREAIITQLGNNSGWHLISCFPISNGHSFLMFSSKSYGLDLPELASIPSGDSITKAQILVDSMLTSVPSTGEPCGSKEPVAMKPSIWQPSLNTSGSDNGQSGTGTFRQDRTRTNQPQKRRKSR